MVSTASITTSPARASITGKASETVLFLPKPVRKPTTVVAQVYPTANHLPENLLKFYLHFSAPMSQGDCYRHIKLLDAKGKAIRQETALTGLSIPLHPGAERYYKEAGLLK